MAIFDSVRLCVGRARVPWHQIALGPDKAIKRTQSFTVFARSFTEPGGNGIVYGPTNAPPFTSRIAPER